MPKKPRDRRSPRYKARVGYEGEYLLLRKFIDSNDDACYAIRTPGSGAGRMAKPDMLAVDHGELLAIEVKSSSKNYAMLNREQVERLVEFSKRFKIKCPHCGNFLQPRIVFAIRFLGRGWKFKEVKMDDVKYPLIVRWGEE